MSKTEIVPIRIEPATKRAEQMPNHATLEAMRQAREGEGLTAWASLDALKAKY